MKRLAALALILACVGCSTSTPILSDAHLTFEALCGLYEENRPVVMEFRVWAAANWSSLPPEVQSALQKIDARLPELDTRGRQVCGLAAVTEPLALSAGRRDEVGAALVKVIGIALEFQRAGVL